MNVISEINIYTNNVCHGVVGCALFGRIVGSKYFQNIRVQSETYMDAVAIVEFENIKFLLQGL